MRPFPPKGSHPDSPLFALGYAQPLTRRPAVRLPDGTELLEPVVAEETPVALIYNGRAHAVMMTTPADLEDFAVGFSLSEGIITAPHELQRVDVVRQARGIELQCTIMPGAAERLASRQRTLVGRTGCGLCGVEALEEAVRDLPPLPAGLRLDAAALVRAERALQSAQPLNEDAHTLHAAAYAHADGTLAIVREDVGRHNALDKVIGALVRDPAVCGAAGGPAVRPGFLVLTSRASYELVQKAAVAQVGLVAAVSRPTGLAIRLAEAMGIALVGLLRDGTGLLYTDPHGVLGASALVADATEAH